MSARDGATSALRRIAYLLERALEPTYRVQAFRTAAAVLDDLTDADFERRLGAGTLKELAGVGAVTERVIVQAAAGEVPEYLQRLEDESAGPLAAGGRRAAGRLRGDLHTHSDWSDGGSPIRGDGPGGARPRTRVRGAHRPLAAADGRQRAVRRSGCCSSSTSSRR